MKTLRLRRAIVLLTVAVPLSFLPRAVAITATGAGAAGAAGTAFRGSATRRDASSGAGALVVASGASAQNAQRSESEALVELMVGRLLSTDAGGPTSVDLDDARMELDQAVARLNGQLPDEVSNLVRITSRHKRTARGEFDEESLQKARRILNGMMEQAWKELDDLIFECKEFQERNRGTYGQVVGDLSRLGSSLALLGERRVGASQGIFETDRLRKETELSMFKERSGYEKQRALDDAEMTIRKNDLAVFDMILMMTKCRDSEVAAAGSLAQLGANSTRRVSSSAEASEQPLQVCRSKDGFELHFDDPKVEAKVEKMMTPQAKRALREILGQASKQAKGQFMQLGEDPSEDDDVTIAPTTSAVPTFPVVVAPVAEEPSPSGQAKKCVDGTPNCGLLHDLMSLEWGRFRDSFDELATSMKKALDEHEIVWANLNQQMTVLNDVRTQHMEVLAEVISGINAASEEMNEKDEQKRELQLEFEKTMADFKAKCSEILFTRICAVRKVRNEILFHSTVSPPSKVTDCDFSDWKSKDGLCFSPQGVAIVCDDTCPQDDPYKCGGLETMKRDVVQAPNSFGMKCPALTRLKKCKQIKCEVKCQLSEWSGWSKCTKECEGGVEVKTRSILQKPKNGGAPCDTVQEEQPCNTGSCDRNCALDVWTSWSPCSMACGGGITSRIRKVVVPIRGEGKCPKAKGPKRFEEEACNTHDCVGDELCIAKQDLILAIDASGSLRESGFEIVRDFAANLTGRYEATYFGNEAMRVGVLLFGNGHLNAQPDGTTTISPAVEVLGLTADMQLVRTTVEELTWQRGFTNMAQAFGMADTMLSQKGRPDAQSAVLVISDGKYSMEYQTGEKARELKDKNVMIYMAPITEVKGPELNVLRGWASQPWETNFERIPGLSALRFNAENFAQTAIAKFCPDSVSPSTMRQQEEEKYYMLIHESGQPDMACGRDSLIGQGYTVDSCADAARTQNLTAFAIATGDGRMAGACFQVHIDVTPEIWEEWGSHREAPPCPGGAWEANPYVDTYILKPLPGPGDAAR